MKLMVELDGETVPLTDCDWVLLQPCGCPRGVLRADSRTRTEDAAGRMFFERRPEREALWRSGCRLELMTHERCCAEVLPKMRLSYVCPHVPPPPSEPGTGRPVRRGGDRLMVQLTHYPDPPAEAPTEGECPVEDVHTLRHGYNLADIDRLARVAVAAAWSQAADARDRYAAAWSAIAETLYTADGRPEPWDLKQIGMEAVNEHGRADRRHHGFDPRKRDAGYEAARRFLQYWELDRHGCHSPEHAVVERTALWQIWPELSETDRGTILALVAHDGDQTAAAAALGKGRSAYVTALSTARHRFLALWLEGETPQRRMWGKADIRRSARYSGTGLVAVRQRQRDQAKKRKEQA